MVSLERVFYNWGLPLAILALIIFIGASVRVTTLSSPTILDYDPWWYYRHAIEIMDNNMQPPKWDLLSYYPPGRPFEPFLGWVYTMIIFYKIAQIFFSDIAFLAVAKWAPVIMVALGGIAAFFLGRLITNKIGGLFTALFAILPPTFIGVSMAGYTDNDPVIVFYTFLSVFSIILAIKKRSVPFYVLAILTNVIFAYNWSGGWFVSLLFLLFLPALAIFRIVEELVHNRNLKVNITNIIAEIKHLAAPLLIVIVTANLIGVITNLGNVFISALIGLGFINPGQGLLVNQSVAELQRINILNRDGFVTLASRIGLTPILFALIGLPLLVIYKLYRKVKIEYYEIFLFLWLAATFFMILNGTRFSLQFSSAAAASAGYVIAQFSKYKRTSLVILTAILLLMTSISGAFLLPTFFVIVTTIFSLFKRGANIQDLHLATLFSITIILSLVFVSEADQVGRSSTGLEIDGNWRNMLEWLKQNADKDALIATWWDPGHIIAGYTGLKVHADGAHCPPGECIPYNHNIRIQDMGRVFSISDEKGAVKILKKYMQLTPEQCNEAKNQYGDKMPKDACKPVSEMYIIASNDLIGKYYWLNFFGTGTGRNYVECNLSQELTQQQNTPSYNCAVGFPMTITIAQKDDQIFAVINMPTLGVRNAISRDVLFYNNNNQEVKIRNNITNNLDSLVFVQPGFSNAIFMEQPVRDSIFTNMFFFSGNGISEFNIPKLEKFKLVYSNPEIRLYKVDFS
ncbi:MAG: hypothetical protein HY361_02215 [Candidatus Aenigmarchaeota archaeon]|nr:hypothetical protein [Candidatus Aenigmarchaeota archaeon]